MRQSESVDGADLGLEEELRAAADRFRGGMDAAEYEPIAFDLRCLEREPHSQAQTDEELNR